MRFTLIFVLISSWAFAQHNIPLYQPSIITSASIAEVSDSIEYSFTVPTGTIYTEIEKQTDGGGYSVIGTINGTGTTTYKEHVGADGNKDFRARCFWYGGIHGAYSTASQIIISSGGGGAAHRFLVDLGQINPTIPDANGNYWNQIINHITGSVNDIFTADNQSSPIDITVVERATGRASIGWETGGGDYLGFATDDYWFIGNPDPCELSFQGFQTGITVDFTFWGSRTNVGTVRIAEFRVNGGAWQGDYETANNTDPNQTYTISGVSPDGSGNITIEFRAKSGSNATYLNIIDFTVNGNIN